VISSHSLLVFASNSANQPRYRLGVQWNAPLMAWRTVERACSSCIWKRSLNCRLLASRFKRYVAGSLRISDAGDDILDTGNGGTDVLKGGFGNDIIDGGGDDDMPESLGKFKLVTDGKLILRPAV